MLMLPCLRRGQGLVVNISKEWSQSSTTAQPVSAVLTKAAFERMLGSLAEKLRHRQVYVLSMWPGLVHTEKKKLQQQQRGQLHGVHDQETVRFTGFAVVTVA